MADTTLTRKSFYVYFRDRAELLAALVQPLRTDTDEAVESWRAATDPVPAGRAALASAARTYRRHGAILRAVFWSSVDDPDLTAARAALVEPVIVAAEATVRTLAPHRFPDARAVATALVTMNVHRLLELRPEASDAELDELVDSLTAVWEATLGSAAGAVVMRQLGLGCPPGEQELSRAFYGRALGFPEIPNLDSAEECAFDMGGVELRLTAEADFRPAERICASLFVDDAQALADRLTSAGHDVVVDEARIRRYRVKDPHGNVIELGQQELPDTR